MHTPKAPTPQQCIDAATVACSQWGIEPQSVEILNESENIVLDIGLRNGRHRVMRLHRPGYNTIHELRSEVAWVEALAASGVPVPKPMAALDGHFYIAAKVGPQERFVGMIEWIDGAALGGPLDSASSDVAVHYGRIGELAGRIRTQSAGWSTPDWFVRRRWDADGLVGTDPIWGRFWEADGLEQAQRSLFTQAREQLHDDLSTLSVDPDRFGMIHADLHLGNLMAHAKGLTVIDFDDAGFGWYAHELAVALHATVGTPSYEQARSAMVAGYRKAHRLDDDEVRLIDTFVTVRCLMIVGWLNDRPELDFYKLLPDLAAQAADITERYLTVGWL